MRKPATYCPLASPSLQVSILFCHGILSTSGDPCNIPTSSMDVMSLRSQAVDRERTYNTVCLFACGDVRMTVARIEWRKMRNTSEVMCTAGKMKVERQKIPCLSPRIGGRNEEMKTYRKIDLGNPPQSDGFHHFTKIFHVGKDVYNVRVIALGMHLRWNACGLLSNRQMKLERDGIVNPRRRDIQDARLSLHLWHKISLETCTIKSVY